jgi:hypothetical protein
MVGTTVALGCAADTTYYVAEDTCREVPTGMESLLTKYKRDATLNNRNDSSVSLWS